MFKKIIIIVVTIVIVLALTFFATLIKKAFASHQSHTVAGISADNQLALCPNKPNCVCSDHEVNDTHYIDALDAKHWDALIDYLNAKSNADIISQTPTYIHATFTTLIMRYVDDVEFHLRPDEGIIAVRSASRVGYSDLGANRKRIESIRSKLNP